MNRLTLPLMDATRVMEPPSGMSLAASRAQYQVPIMLMSNSFLILSVGYSCATKFSTIPAAVTTASSRPNLSLTVSKTCLTEASLETSQPRPIASISPFLASPFSTMMACQQSIWQTREYDTHQTSQRVPWLPAQHPPA